MLVWWPKSLHVMVSLEATMRIGLISDTHIPGGAMAIPQEVVRAFEGVELILHSGNIYTAASLDWLERIAPVKAAGSVDRDRKCGERERPLSPEAQHEKKILMDYQGFSYESACFIFPIARGLAALFAISQAFGFSVSGTFAETAAG